MGIQNVGGLSLGQWIAIVRTWNKAHAPEGHVDPPTVDEFHAAMEHARALH